MDIELEDVDSIFLVNGDEEVAKADGVVGLIELIGDGNFDDDNVEVVGCLVIEISIDAS